MSGPFPNNPPVWSQPAPKLTPQQQRDAALLAWKNAKLALDAAKDAEMAARNSVVEMFFPNGEGKEGMNTVQLGNGYELKYGKKLNYSLKSPTDGVKDIDAVDDVIDAFAKCGNEGSFIADRLFKFTAELSISEYRTLCEDAKTDPYKGKMLELLNTILVIKPGAPTLEIKEPKSGRR